MKILLLSGYDAASHRYWRNILAEKLDQFEWTQVALPDRHFYWRSRGNSLSFAFEHKQILEQDYDLCIATSMVDLSSLRGFCPKLANLPTVVYFHENQFAYPVQEQQPNLINVQLTSIYTALCADKILFNSEYNLKTFIEGAENLLKRMPDLVPKGLIEIIKNCSTVLPVPIDILPSSLSTQSKNEPVQIVWNHRWEYDKQPDVFFDALKKLKQQGVSFKLHIMGQSFRQQPACFDESELFFADEIETYGYQDKKRYREILSQADYVVSTALHDFQGLSLQEAISLGCTPIAPNRVAYPEYVPQSGLYDVTTSPNDEVNNLYDKLEEMLTSNTTLKVDLSSYSCDELIPQYQAIFRTLV